MFPHEMYMNAQEMHRKGKERHTKGTWNAPIRHIIGT
jgi:hypothetical protein